jgi:hypothetical protein
VYEATGHMLRVFHPHPPSEALQSTKGGISIKFIDGQTIQTGAIPSSKILIYGCSTLSEEGILIPSLYFRDLELFVLTYWVTENPFEQMLCLTLAIT